MKKNFINVNQKTSYIILIKLAVMRAKSILQIPILSNFLKIMVYNT